MSKANSPRKGSPLKHKGLKSSLYADSFQRVDNNIYTSNPSRIYVQTVNDQPNVLPYIDSIYTNQQQQIDRAQSEYVIMNQGQKNLMTNIRPGMISNVRVSPMGLGYQMNLSRTKFEVGDNSRINNASTYVPPPPESFLVPNSKIIENRSPSMQKTVVSSLPISSQVPVQVPVQSVKKTFVPHHIINQIPVYTGAVYAESGYRSSDPQQQSGGNEQSQQVLMGYYEKLYAKYEQQKQLNFRMNQELSGAVNEINYLRQQLQSQPQMQKISSAPTPAQRKVIDKMRLQDLLMSKMSRVVDEAIDRRKQNCLRQVSSMIESRRVTIKIPGQVYSYEASSLGYDK